MVKLSVKIASRMLLLLLLLLLKLLMLLLLNVLLVSLKTDYSLKVVVGVSAVVILLKCSVSVNKL